MNHTNTLDCSLRCLQCGQPCSAHPADQACPGGDAGDVFHPPEDLTSYADEAQQVLRPVMEHSGAAALVLMLAPTGEIQIRSTDPNLDINAIVGVLFRSAQTVHTTRSLVTFIHPGEPGKGEAPP